MYDAWNALHREGRAFVRLQINFLHNQGFTAVLSDDIANQLPELRERLKNQFQFFGDAMLRTGAIGEWAAPFGTPGSANCPVWLEAQRLCARARWRNENSQAGSPTSTANIEQVVATYEMVDAEMIAEDFPDGIKSLRWGLQHADHATEDQLARLKALNCGVSMSGFRWLQGNPRADGLPVGPLFPRILASGARRRGPTRCPSRARWCASSATASRWGTNWPHAGQSAAPDDGQLVDLLAEIAPSEAQRQALLVDNPQRLYRFPQPRRR